MWICRPCYDEQSDQIFPTHLRSLSLEVGQNENQILDCGFHELNCGPQIRYAEILTPSTSEYNLIWK